VKEVRELTEPITFGPAEALAGLDTIVNRALWPDSESRFGAQQILAERFNQLADLRNGIRHSGAVDEVTQ
jgi:hypothetical protein